MKSESMELQGMNPFLPRWEYVPDGEPHVFGDRVYLYGSHDRFGGPLFCMEDYVCWSAPVENLRDWRCEGVIYRKDQDPMNPKGKRCLYAPDVCRGPDGRFYLYYAFDFFGVISVAVCDTPAGQYEFLGHVRFADGHILGRKSGEPFPFDPGVLCDEDGRVYLYFGFATRIPFFMTGGYNLNNHGGYVAELEPDMVTLKTPPRLLFPRKGRKGAFAGHAFFEASSIRKADGRYCFVYSSEHNHELCYAFADSPMGPFEYGGTLVDIGDVFLNGKEGERSAVNYLGNTHGSIEKINGEYYVFYHRQTNRHSYSRQACAEKLVRDGRGGFCQAEVTSCGLNGGPLRGQGTYEARIACNLSSARGTGRYDSFGRRVRFLRHPYFTQSAGKQPEAYICNMRNRAFAGFKRFDFCGLKRISVEVRGSGGAMRVALDKEFRQTAACISLEKTSAWKVFGAEAAVPDGTRDLFFRYEGKGKVDFKSFTLE